MNHWCYWKENYSRGIEMSHRDKLFSFEPIAIITCDSLGRWVNTRAVNYHRVNWKSGFSFRAVISQRVQTIIDRESIQKTIFPRWRLIIAASTCVACKSSSQCSPDNTSLRKLVGRYCKKVSLCKVYFNKNCKNRFLRYFYILRLKRFNNMQS